LKKQIAPLLQVKYTFHSAAEKKSARRKSDPSNLKKTRKKRAIAIDDY